MHNTINKLFKKFINWKINSELSRNIYSLEFKKFLLSHVFFFFFNNIYINVKRKESLFHDITLILSFY